MERFWRAVEAIHDVVYFAPDTKERYGALGLRGYWRGYFASRAAALGTPSAELVTATFFGFAPDFVARAVPEVWQLADREQVLATRRSVAADALRSVWGDRAVPSEALADVVGGLDLAGFPLAAAEAALPPSDDPVERLWQSVTVLRELHGDAHVAVLLANGLDGATSNALAVAVGLAPADQPTHRGWSDEEWARAHITLSERGWVSDGRATDAGRTARAEVEATTHAVAERAPRDVGAAAALTEELVGLAAPIGGTLVPRLNPTAVPLPEQLHP